MTTEIFNKLIAAGFDVQTQNQGTTVTVSYTQAGPSFDSNLKEIEEKFKLINDGNTPINTGVTSDIYEWRGGDYIKRLEHICSSLRNSPRLY